MATDFHHEHEQCLSGCLYVHAALNFLEENREVWVVKSKPTESQMAYQNLKDNT